ncbi:hypothetical protein BBP40_007711 [Aspergillus hancockii]|nr:hypothetical protein BBP40_007711 [Aspergillus hancockii]
MAQVRLRCEDYSVGWVCALPIELAAAQEMLDEEHDRPDYKALRGDTLYTFGHINQHNVVIACLPAGQIGTSIAAMMATRMTATFTSIRFVLMVGVGGGIPSQQADIRLGDVVISQPGEQHGGVVQYDFGKDVPQGFRRSGTLNKPPTMLLQAINNLKAKHLRRKSALAEYLLPLSNQRTFIRPETDDLFKWDYEHVEGPTCEKCDPQNLVKRSLRQNKDVMVHYGIIASGNRVIRDGKTRQMLRDELGDIICFDMEAAGLMDCFPCLVIRGICDYSDSHKNKDWQPYAAIAAAAATKELLSVIPATQVREMPSADPTTAKLEALQSAIDKFKMDEVRRSLLVVGSAMVKTCYDLPIERTECLWVFKNVDFQRWYSSQSSQILWLSAQNQSSLCNVARHVLDDCYNKQPPSQRFKLIAFCSPGKEEKLSGIKVFHTIFLQLLLTLSEEQQMAVSRKVLQSLFYGIVKSRRESKMDNAISKWSIFDRIGLILDAPIHDITAALEIAISAEVRDLWLILDGIDKVEIHGDFIENVRRFVNNLDKKVSTVHILLTSQSDPVLSKAFDGIPFIEHDKERKECLQSLQFHNTRFDKISKGHKGSFDWLWAHEEYEKWSVSNSSQLLYVQGKPGSGKSTLAKHFVNNLVAKLPLACDAVIARFFYSFREGELQTSHYSMLLTILYDILSQDESFFYHHFQPRYRRLKMELQRSSNESVKRVSWDYEVLKEQLSSLEDHCSPKPIFLVIDAVDESDTDDRREILRLLYGICATTKHCTLKIFVASRPVAHEPSRGSSHHFIKLQNETKADIAKFARSFLNGLESTHFMDLAINFIVQNAQGVFLWVELVGRELVSLAEGGYAARDIFAYLKELPKELEAFYVMMFQRMKQDRRNLRDGLKIFHFVLFSARSLRGNELLHALGIQAEPGIEINVSDESFQACLPTDLTRRLISCGGNFLEIQFAGLDPGSADIVDTPKQTGTVQVIHQTVREFFLNKEGCVAESEFQIISRDAHRCIAITCLRYLNFCMAGSSSQEMEMELYNDGWDTEYFAACASYLQSRPLLCYTLEHLQHHLQHLEHDTFTNETITSVFERIRHFPASYLLEGWTKSVLHTPEIRPGLRRNATQFRNRMLHAACRKGCSLAVEILLLLGVDIDSKDESGSTPLWRAAEHGHDDTVVLLMAKGADIRCQNKNKQTALSRAASNGHDAVVMRLADSVPHSPDDSSETPLSYAAANGHVEVIRVLLDERRRNLPYHSDPTVTNSSQQTAVSQAAANGHRNAVQALIDCGASIEVEDSFGMTPLFHGARTGNETMVRILMGHGASIHRRDTYGEMPLAWAAQNGHEGMTKMLLEEGAPADETDRDGRTPLSRAAGNGHLPVVTLLLRHGAAVDSRDVFDRSPLSWAASGGHTATADLLLQNGAQVDSQAQDGRTPLAWATGKGHRETAKLLIDSKTRVDRAIHSRQRPLSRATEFLLTEVTNRLHERGADRMGSSSRIPMRTSAASYRTPHLVSTGYTMRRSFAQRNDRGLSSYRGNKYQGGALRGSSRQRGLSGVVSSTEPSNSSTEVSASSTPKATVETHFREEETRREGRYASHGPVDTNQALWGNQPTTDSEGERPTFNMDDTRSRRKREHSPSEENSPSPKRRRAEEL